MSWTNIDDRIMQHPKMKRAVKLKGDAAWCMWSRGLVYTNAYDLDGRIPKDVVDELTTDRRPFEVASVLVDVGLWELREDGDYQVHDFAEYNDSRAERDARRKASKERLKKHRDKKAGIVTNAEQNTLSPDVCDEGETRFKHDGETENERDSKKVIPSQATPIQATPSRREEARPPEDPNAARILEALRSIPSLDRLATRATAEQIVAHVNGGGKKLEAVLAAIREFGEQEAMMAGSLSGPTEINRLAGGLRSFVGNAKLPRVEPGRTPTQDQVRVEQARRGQQQGSAGPPRRVVREGAPDGRS